MTPTTPVAASKTLVSPAENQKNIEAHKKAATHLEAAAKHQTEAAEHHEQGNHENAAQSTIKANGHLSLAKEALREDAKQHALSTPATK